MKLIDIGRTLCVALAASAIGVTSSFAALLISSKPTRNVSCSAGVCAATAGHATLNATELANMLASGDVTVMSGSAAHDIEVNASLSWVSTSRLTLDAYQSVAFVAPVVVAGTGALTITTNHGGRNGDFRFYKKGHVEFWDLASRLIINGASYELESKLKRLVTDIRNNGHGNYALARSSSEKNHIYLKSPIPSFSGSFEGLGNTISDLTISATVDRDSVALIGSLGQSGSVRDVRLHNAAITATGSGEFDYAGTLVGTNSGTIANSHAAGSVIANNMVSGGGLVGFNEVGTIRNSFADVAVSGSGSDFVGGLVGLSQGLATNNGVVQESFATGTVSGSDGAMAGGLIGKNWGAAIFNSYATGSATGGANAQVGGLVGGNIDDPDEQSIPRITASYSTGAVSGGSGSTIGGLIGQDAADAQITDAYWDLETSGISDPHKGAGNVSDDPGITGLMTAQFKSGLPPGISPFVWSEKTKLNSGYPYLIDNQPPK